MTYIKVVMNYNLIYKTGKMLLKTRFSVILDDEFNYKSKSMVIIMWDSNG